MSDSDDTQTEPTGTDEIKADIERTRAELADTVDQLSDKLNVKSQVGHKADSVKESFTDGAAQLKQSAPVPVQHALDTIGAKTGPFAHRVNDATAPHRSKIVAAVVGVVAVLLVVRRVRGGDES